MKFLEPILDSTYDSDDDAFDAVTKSLASEFESNFTATPDSKSETPGKRLLAYETFGRAFVAVPENRIIKLAVEDSDNGQELVPYQIVPHPREKGRYQLQAAKGCAECHTDPFTIVWGDYDHEDDLEKEKMKSQWEGFLGEFQDRIHLRDLEDYESVREFPDFANFFRRSEHSFASL
jgi:hypothetical protein